MSTENETTMTKQEILEVVKQMLADWQAAYDSKDIQTVHELNCITGFCLYVMCFVNESILVNIILLELFKDLQTPQFFNNYWYDIFLTEKNFSLLQPRIDHLQRTIARLENEIANENTTS